MILCTKESVQGKFEIPGKSSYISEVNISVHFQIKNAATPPGAVHGVRAQLKCHELIACFILT